MKKYFLIFFLFYGCNDQKAEQASVEFTNKLLKQAILGYINFSSAFKDENKIITVSFMQTHDTVSLGIVNSYPDLKLAKFNGLTVLNGYRICLVGDYPQNEFYKVKGKGEAPQDIVNINKQYQDLKKVPYSKELEPWYLLFKNKRVLQYTPKQQFDKFVPEFRALIKENN